MEDTLSTQERQLCQLLAELPKRYNYKYTPDAPRDLLHGLFWFLAGGRDEYMRLLFKNGKPSDALKLADAQGAVGGAEYTEAARGKRCGHIFKPGEASYMCRTCGTDETCCLCSRCFDSTDHTGHMVRISISVGNSGCCDCGDDEAWKTPLFCTVHSDTHRPAPDGKGKDRVAPSLPEDLVNNIRMTVGRVLDYICDVISCSPEQLRENKTKESILKDEETSRLSSAYYGQDAGACTRFDLVLWNDEKHTVNEVQDQVARACRKSPDAASKNAWETDTIGRSLLVSLPDVDRLIQMAKTMESIRVTVTIRSSRDTFREQMCGTLVEWLSDISGCSVGHDNRILRQTVCEELMKPWRQGSSATHTSGLIDDEEEDDQSLEARSRLRNVNERFILALQAANGNLGFVSDDDDDDADADADNDDGDADMDEPDDGNDSGSAASGEGDDDILMVDTRGEGPPDVGMSWVVSESLEEDEATMAGYPPPPPPPPAAPPTASRPANRDRDGTPSDSDAAEPLIAQSVYAKANLTIPKTPGKSETMVPRPGRYWIETPAVYTQRENVPLSEDVFQRVRLDWLLLFDLRMWKKVRNDLRSLYISTVVQVPEFKRVLALRFASLYTVLAQLYLVGDREPDHSIINLSLQMLTTPSITAEVVERGNFLSSLFAILYTFLTTRQVGHPWDVSPDAVLAFDSGSVTNRRMYHFYQDLKYLFGSEHVQERLRSEPRYLMQFLDLVKLHQCIGPNVRAVIEHVEYEADSWITASLVTRQINLQARNLAEAFRDCAPDEIHHLQRAIRTTAKAVIINSIGAERHRFKTGEIKEEVRFKTLSDFEFDAQGSHYDVVKFVVEKDPISFHHALHYTLSWLIECGRALPASVVRNLLSFTAQELRAKPSLMGRPQLPKKQHYDAQDFLIAAFDYPLRVCAWLAQIKANMWVRNGISLRHQASTYRGVGQRDVSHHRDIFLLQVALVVCDPSRMLASIIDRFGMDGWVKGLFEMKSEAQDDSQHLDVVEDMIHLLIVLLTDRTSLLAPEDGESSRILAMRRDVTHVLCFKPLSFNEICLKLPEKYQEQEDFHRVLNEMATFKPPEGVSDVGTFELRQEFIEDIDPYIAHYNRNQREESELAYRKKMAKKTGQTPQSIVFEPKPRPIPSGLFQNLADVTGTGVFAQVIYYSLLYTLVANRWTPSVPSTRLETFIQVLLHLILIAIQEDQTTEDHDENEHDQDPNQNQDRKSFVYTALTKHARSNFMSEASNCTTIVSLLHLMSLKFKAAHPKIAVVMKRLKQKRPEAFDAALARIGVSPERFSTASPSNASVEEERERKKKAALSRQAKVMAHFQEQQNTFLANQGAIDWGSDLGDDDDDRKTGHPEDRKHNWKFPSGTCILCQEEADDRRLYGTFALVIESRILRQTDFQDPDFVREASQTPCNLDRSADDIRPFGVAGENRRLVEKFNASGELLLAERQTIGKGFKGNLSRPGPVAKSCGHIMHYRCFEQYCEAINRRHSHQIARHHPENTRLNEFVCPLCKALGNAFLPIVWQGFEEAYPGHLQPKVEFEEFMERQMGQAYWFRGSKAREGEEPSIPSMSSPSLRGSLIEAMVTRSSDINTTLGVILGDLRGADRAEAWSLVLGSAGGALTTPVPELNNTEAMVPAPAPAPAPAPTTAPPPAESSWTQPFLNELLAALRRLGHTLVLNKLTSSEGVLVLGDELHQELHSSGVLVQAAAFSVSAAEIQQRGVEAQPGKTLLDKIPEQSLAFLRVLSETVYTYITMGTKYPTGGTRVEGEFLAQVERQHHQLFMARYYEAETSGSRQPLMAYPALLSSDPFVFLVECTFGVVAARDLEMMHVVRLCYLAELVKVVFHMGESVPSHQWLSIQNFPETQDPAMLNFARFFQAVMKQRADTMSSSLPKATGEKRGFLQPGVDTLEGWYTFVKKYALVFLRKCVVWLHVNRGVDFNSHFSSNPDADELDRLTEALRLPSFDEMCAAMTDDAAACGWPSTTQAVVRGWVKHQVLWSEEHQGQAKGSAMVSHPGIFELLGLPNTYDTLIEEATRRKCPTTGNDLSDPVICLFCGELFCSQSACCLKQEGTDLSRPLVGGAQQHMKRCQNNMGIFLNIRKCAVIYLFHKSGSYTAVPYIDRYGETDHLLRHGRQLFLNQKRYDSMIRSLVLSHGIPSLISRKLEAEINNGGWDTL